MEAVAVEVVFSVLRTSCRCSPSSPASLPRAVLSVSKATLSTSSKNPWSTPTLAKRGPAKCEPHCEWTPPQVLRGLRHGSSLYRYAEVGTPDLVALRFCRDHQDRYLFFFKTRTATFHIFSNLFKHHLFLFMQKESIPLGIRYMMF